MFRPMNQKVSTQRVAAHDAVETAVVFIDFFASTGFHSVPKNRDFVTCLNDRAEAWLAQSGGRTAALAVLDADWLRQPYVCPRFWSRFIGSAFFSHMKSRRPKGFKVWTFQANNTGTRRFHERHGLQATEFTGGAHNEERMPDVQYVRKRTRAQP